ncbi:MAG: DUF5687 family protein, partial [Prevotellaceae bacterium]|nr:DUF5687 family protein [Prevotellaceae bacterium]
MVVLDLLKQEWLKSRRAKAFYKNLAVNILLIVAALYFAAIFLVMGFYLGAILEKIAISEKSTPMALFNGAMLYIMLGGILMRLFMQQLGTINLLSYQILPIKRSTLVNFLLLKPLASPLNYMTLLVVIPFAVRSVSNYHDGATAFRFVLNIVFIIWFNSLLTAFLKRRFSADFKFFLVIIAIAAAIVALEAFRLFSFSDASELIFGFLLNHSWGSVLVFLLPAAAFAINKRFFARNYYPEHFNRKIDKSNTAGTPMMNLSFFDRFGSIGDFIALELKLILRHKRTKSMLYVSLIFLFYGLLFYTQKAYNNSAGWLFFIALFSTGFLMMMYGQWIISWDSAYFDGLMTKNIPIRSYMTANYYLLVAFNVISFVLTTPYFLFGTKIIQMHLAAFLFNAGVNIPVFL